MEPRCCCFKEHITPEECPFLREEERELLFSRKGRFLNRCLECPRFLENLRALGREADGLAPLVLYAVEEILDLRARARSLAGQIEARNREIKFLHEVSLVLQTSVDKDEVIAMALTAVTAGKGFGLNRAILLLADRERQLLRGYFAVGPRQREEAARIWREIEEQDHTLREMAQLFFEQKMAAEREKFGDLLEQLSVPLARTDHLFVRVLNDQLSRHVPDLFQEPGLDRPQAEALGVREMLLVPLISKNRRIGLLLADNIINGRPITTDDLHSLETFALPVSFAIERAALYERLREELTKLTEANRRLKEQQEQLVRMEKMALTGQIAASLAHSIRNPLTIIGGFARSLLKGTPPEDGRHPYLDSIVRETRRLEDALQEVLATSESLHPTLDQWDINQMVAAVYAGLQEELELSGIECRLDFAPDLPLVRVDYKQLSYCLRSLAGHLLQILPRGGRMEIRTARSAEELQIVTAGLALAGEARTPPLLRSAEAGEDGGLGLALCRRILEGHDAAFEMHSLEGGGVSYTIRLSLPTEESHAATADR